MTRKDEFQKVIEAVIMLFHESAEYHRDDSVRKTLQQCLSVSVRLYRHLSVAKKRYVVAVVGLGNVGKSTLINAIFESEIAPRRNGPCTAVPIEFVNGTEPTLYIEYHHSLARREVKCASLGELQDELDGIGNDATGQSNQSIRKVIVAFPHPLLADGLVLADTPGFGAAQIGDGAGTHERALQEYLQNEVCQAIWVVLAEQAIGAREFSFFSHHLADVCDHVAVTGCEDWGPEDCKRLHRRLARPFGHRAPEFHFVSGITRDGVADLAKSIQKLATPTERYRVVAQGLWVLSRSVSQWLCDYRDGKGSCLRYRWRPDSWARLEAAPECSGLRKRLVEVLGTVG